MESNYKAIKNGKGIYNLIDENNNAKICPYGTRILVPIQNTLSGPGPQLAIEEKPCSSTCPHFEINQGQAVITCVKDQEKYFTISE